jgi:hypothetical protein
MRVLAIGGTSDFVHRNLQEKFGEHGLVFAHHWDFELSKCPDDAPENIDGILVFRDMVGHFMSDKSKEIARKRNLPLVMVGRKIAQALPLLRLHGFVKPFSEGDDSEPLDEEGVVALLREAIESEITLHDRVPSKGEIQAMAQRALGAEYTVSPSVIIRARNEAVRNVASTLHTPPEEGVNSEIIRPNLPCSVETGYTDPADWVPLLVEENPSQSLSDLLNQLNTLSSGVDMSSVDLRERIIQEKVRVFEAQFASKGSPRKEFEARKVLGKVEEGRDFFANLTEENRATIAALVLKSGRAKNNAESFVVRHLANTLTGQPIPLTTVLLLACTTGARPVYRGMVLNSYKAITGRKLGPYYLDAVSISLGFEFDKERVTVTLPPPSTVKLEVPKRADPVTAISKAITDALTTSEPKVVVEDPPALKKAPKKLLARVRELRDAVTRLDAARQSDADATLAMISQSETTLRQLVEDGLASIRRDAVGAAFDEVAVEGRWTDTLNAREKTLREDLNTRITTLFDDLRGEVQTVANQNLARHTDLAREVRNLRESGPSTEVAKLRDLMLEMGQHLDALKRDRDGLRTALANQAEMITQLKASTGGYAPPKESGEVGLLRSLFERGGTITIAPPSKES